MDYYLFMDGGVRRRDARYLFILLCIRRSDDATLGIYLLMYRAMRQCDARYLFIELCIGRHDDATLGALNINPKPQSLSRKP